VSPNGAEFNNIPNIAAALILASEIAWDNLVGENHCGSRADGHINGGALVG
jgi:hypothetical protein